MAEAAATTALPSEALPSDPPPAPLLEGESPSTLQPTIEQKSDTSSPIPEKGEDSKSLAAMMEKEEETDGISKSTAVKEETVVVESGKEKQIEEEKKIPQSLISFKEESNRVSDLSDSERKALEELKQLVEEGLNTHQFSTPPPPKDEAKQISLATGEPLSESDVTAGISTSAVGETKVEEKTEKEPMKGESPAEGSFPPPEVSIWGIPLLKDDRSDVILLKFLRARDFNVKDAWIMLKNTMQWRKDFKIEELVDGEDLGEDLEKVVFMHGDDRDGHPVCYNVYGEFQNKELYHKMLSDEEKRKKFLRWRVQFLERSIRKLDFRPGGISTVFQVNDLKNSPGPGKRELRIVTRQALQLLQDNYPEFVAKQVFINVPWWYLAFYTMISPFMTQRTKSKFVFAGPSKSAEILFKYISPEQVPIQYGGLSVDYCDCNPEFTTADPAAEITVKPATKQTVEIIIYEKCIITWEIRVVGWEVSYGAEFVPDAKDSYTVIIHKSRKVASTDEPVVSSSFKVGELGRMLLTVDNPTSKKKKLLYRFKINPFSD